MRTKNSVYGAAVVIFLSVLMAGALVGPAYGVSYDLYTGTVDKTMPDATVVPMWGFGCDGAQAGCGDGTSTAITVPGPQLMVPVGDPTLTINLRNTLAEAVSIVVPGLIPAAGAPVKFDDGTGRMRTMSFVPEAAASGGVASYTWNNVPPGTYIYESGTHPSVHVQMGLYGSVKKDFAAGQAYSPESAYGSEAVLLFSEIDPVLHAAIDNGSYGTPPAPTSTMYYRPLYYMINGEAYSADRPPVAKVATADNTLVRFLNSGLLTRTPVLLGVYMHPIAEDGKQYGIPKTEYSIDLGAGKTYDALVDFSSATGCVTVFDRKGGLTNSTSSPGGMIGLFYVAFPIKVGVFRDGQWYMDVNGNGIWDAGTDNFTTFGLPGDVPVTGDWTGTCRSKIGVFRNGEWFLDMDGNGLWNPANDTYTIFGLPGDVQVTGDWDGTGTTKIGVFRNGQWYLDMDGDNLWNPANDTFTVFGLAGDVPVTGDWDGSGTTKIGVFRNGQWYLDMDGDGIWNPAVDTFTIFGLPGDVGITGDWGGTGTTKIGVFRNAVWYLDTNGNGIWNAGTDTVTTFGLPGDQQATGTW